MSALRQKVLGRPVQIWAESFLTSLAESRRDTARVEIANEPALRWLAERLAVAPRVILALDYDGTLVPIQKSPELARPDEALTTLLHGLSRLRGVRVDVVSGRTRDSLEDWLGALPIGLVAEHGFWFKKADENDWHSAVDPTTFTWKGMVRAVLEEYAMRTPGALIEDKTAGLAWHYRNATPHLGTLRARELRAHLVQSLAQTPVTILTGRKVVEVRPQGIDKGQGIRLLGDLDGAEIAAFGDDRTDEDLFAALPETSHTFRSGPGPTRARFRLNGPKDVRYFLNRFLELRRAAS